jgi:hypothetical protein
VVVHVQDEVLTHHRQPDQSDVATCFCHLSISPDRSSAQNHTPGATRFIVLIPFSVFH